MNPLLEHWSVSSESGAVYFSCEVINMELNEFKILRFPLFVILRLVYLQLMEKK